MKSLTDVKLDMSVLYDEVRTGKVEVKLATELANIAGKYLKAEQLLLAREIFARHGNTPRAAHALDTDDGQLGAAGCQVEPRRRVARV